MELTGKRKKIISIWLLSGAFLVLLMVVVGGVTRLTHSGLSMTDWNLVVGSVPPLSEDAWNQSFEDYKQYPEYKELNYHFTLDEYKSIFWWEYIHRALGRIIGLVFLIPFLYFLFRRWIGPKLAKHLVIVFCMGAFQAFLGWFMVKSGLIDVPHVSHYRLAAHLMTAFLTCLYICWIVFELNLPRTPSVSHMLGLRKQAIGLLVLTLVQAVYGAFVAGLRAGWVHNTFPLMDGQLVADAVFAMDPMYLNFLEGKSGVQFIHRLLGIAVLVWSVVFYFKAIRNLGEYWQVLSVRMVFIMTLLQVSLGVATLMLQVPLAFGVLHQLGAILLLIAILFSIHRLTPPATPKSESGA